MKTSIKLMTILTVMVICGVMAVESHTDEKAPDVTVTFPDGPFTVRDGVDTSVLVRMNVTNNTSAAKDCTLFISPSSAFKRITNFSMRKIPLKFSKGNQTKEVLLALDMNKVIGNRELVITIMVKGQDKPFHCDGKSVKTEEK